MIWSAHEAGCDKLGYFLCKLIWFTHLFFHHNGADDWNFGQTSMRASLSLITRIDCKLPLILIIFCSPLGRLFAAVANCDPPNARSALAACDLLYIGGNRSTCQPQLSHRFRHCFGRRYWVQIHFPINFKPLFWLPRCCKQMGGRVELIIYLTPDALQMNDCFRFQWYCFILSFLVHAFGNKIRYLRHLFKHVSPLSSFSHLYHLHLVCIWCFIIFPSKRNYLLTVHIHIAGPSLNKPTRFDDFDDAVPTLRATHNSYVARISSPDSGMQLFWRQLWLAAIQEWTPIACSRFVYFIFTKSIPRDCETTTTLRLSHTQFQLKPDGGQMCCEFELYCIFSCCKSHPCLLY